MILKQRQRYTNQAKSHVLNHRAASHFFLVQGFPYASGLRYTKFQSATINKTAAICKRTRGFKVDVMRSKTPHDRRIAKYSAGK